MKYKLLISIIGTILIALTCKAGNVMFEQANKQYHNQKYAEAANLYQQLIADGFINSAILYNAGNANYKNKKYGKALWYFLRARQLDPSNISIEENIALTRRTLGIGKSSYQENGLLGTYHRFLKWHQINTWALFSLLFLSLAAIIYVTRKFRGLAAIFLGIQQLLVCLGIFYLIGTIGNAIHAKTTHLAVVIKSTNGISTDRSKRDVPIKEGEIVVLVNPLESKLLNSGTNTRVRLNNGVVAIINLDTILPL